MPERDDFADLPALARFGEALDAAARGGLPSGRAARARRWMRGVGLGLAVALGVAATAAATVAALRGTVISAPDAGVVPSDQASLAGSSVLTSPRAVDPFGGPPWALRLTRSQSGLTCTTVGQVRDGVFGIVGEDRVFRQIPAAVVDSCGRGLLLGSRIIAAATSRATRSVVFGVAGSTIRSVALDTAGGGRRPLPLGERGTFVAALRGYPEDTAAQVDLTAADGRITRRSLGARPGLVPDIGGEPAWRLARYEIGTRQYCTRLGDARRPRTRALSPSGPSGGGSSLPTACIARRGTAAWAVQALRMRPGERGAPGFDRWQYTGRPPRTIVLGIAREPGLVRQVTVTGAGARRVLTPARNGTFALVLPAAIDPRVLRFSVRLHDGTVQHGRSAHGIVPDLVASRRPR
ncbi:MAG: hypothetical protein LC798_01750 [Chloroflexi bacterium]|nr:hypothetical protein [Chloroflexota bacterium]